MAGQYEGLSGTPTGARPLMELAGLEVWESGTGWGGNVEDVTIPC